MEPKNVEFEVKDPGETGDPRRSPHGRNVMIGAHGVAFLFGVGLLVFLIYNVGYRSILESISNVGWGFIFVFALNFIRHICRAASMYFAVEPEHRNFKFRSALAARFGGEAVTFFTFTGPFLGDAAKAILLKRNLPLTYGASAVIIDNILYYLTVIFMVLAGIALLVATYGTGGEAVGRVLTGTVIVSLVMFAAFVLAIKYRVTPLSSAISFLVKRELAPKFFIRKQKNIKDVERIVFDFYHDRKRVFFTLFAVSIGVHAISVVEVYLIMHLLGFVNATVSTAFIIESLTKIINAAFGFIPGTVGVYEGGNGLILRILGYTTAVGVALALVRRGAILLSTIIGVGVLLWRTAERGAQKLAEAKEQRSSPADR
jgi:uncharacterized membrane protein YbhN (UPF0104 family)